MNKTLNAVGILICSAFLWVRPAGAGDGPNRIEDTPDFSGLDVQASRALWRERTAGNNLALGKEVRFSKKPDYSLTTDPNDAFDLTRGTLSPDDRVWYHKSAVGWCNAGSPQVNLLVDLGHSEPVGRLALRIVCGREQKSITFPAEFRVVASQDGKTFHEVLSSRKLLPAERSLANGDTLIFLPEKGTAYCYPFLFNLNVEARYIGITLMGDGAFLFMDSLAILKGEPSAARALSTYTKKSSFIMDGVRVGPLKEGPLYISTNVLTPNFLEVTDCRTVEEQKTPAELFVELPVGISLRDSTAHNEQVMASTVSERGEAFRVWSLSGLKSLYLDGRPLPKQGPYYFEWEGDGPDATNRTATFYAVLGGEKVNSLTIPIQPVGIPEVPPWADYNFSLGWMGEKAMRNWPDFFRTHRRLGFTTLGYFVRNWEAPDLGGRAYWEAHVQKAREAGFKILYQESPLQNVFERGTKGSGPREPEVCHVVDGKPGKNPCVSYRGPLYRNEMARIERAFAALRPDYCFWDIECISENGGPLREAANCSRCQEAFRESKQPDFNRFLESQGRRILMDLRRIASRHCRELKIPMPRIGNYNEDVVNGTHDAVFVFEDDYPSAIDMAQPSLYVQGDCVAVHETIRKNYGRLGKKDVEPFLTTGTYGEYDPKKIEPMILETLLNGAGGFSYFCFDDFDSPLDFYYHAKALSELAPYQELLKRGAPTPLAGDNPDLSYSSYADGDRMLLLVGNYHNAPNGATTVQLPWSRVASIRDIGAGTAIPPQSPLVLMVPPGGWILLEITGEPDRNPSLWGKWIDRFR
jgi:hypothetical protein